MRECITKLFQSHPNDNTVSSILITWNICKSYISEFHGTISYINKIFLQFQSVNSNNTISQIVNNFHDLGNLIHSEEMRNIGGDRGSLGETNHGGQRQGALKGHPAPSLQDLHPQTPTPSSSRVASPNSPTPAHQGLPQTSPIVTPR